MGGRGASLGMSVKGKPYGTEYKTLFSDGNIKFISINEGATTAPMETMTKGRVYVTVNKVKNVPVHITYFDKDNKRYKQIDISGHEHFIKGSKVLPHVHKGYEHDENGTRKVTTKEAKLIEKVNKLWNNYITG